MTDRIDWARADDPQDVVHQLVERLYQGQLVVFPTGSRYALAGYSGESRAMERLSHVPPGDEWTPALAVRDAQACHSIGAPIGTTGRRLIERGLPGPIVVLLQDVSESCRIAPQVRALVRHDGRIAVRMPDHLAIHESLRLLPADLVIVDGPPSATNPTEALRAFGSVAHVLVDDGACPFTKPTTVVQVDGVSVRVVREGVVPANRVERLTAEILTFVCTGNSCRSPMAEALFRVMLAADLGCDPEELPHRGFILQSAGLAAFDGGPASREAQQIVRDYGASLDDHASQSLTSDLVRLSDRLLVMTRDHRSAIVSQWPEAEWKTTLLAGDGDISDPMGQGVARYRRCAEEIHRHLQRLLSDIKSKGSAAWAGETRSGGR